MTKSWIAQREGRWSDDDELVLVHADTRGQAVAQVANEIGCDFVEARVQRWPAMDGLAATDFNLLVTGTAGWVGCRNLGCINRIITGVDCNTEDKDGSPYAYNDGEENEEDPMMPLHAEGVGMFCSASCYSRWNQAD